MITFDELEKSPYYNRFLNGPYTAAKGRTSLPLWRYREELSRASKLRRSYYELLRDDLDQLVLKFGLVDSFYNFKRKDLPFPFVERRELKPRARIPGTEYDDVNSFLLIFVEDTIPSAYKKYIRFFDVNKATKTNLISSGVLNLSDDFDRNQKYLDSVQFTDFMNTLLKVDYALLIQRDESVKAKDRYGISHYHVRIDWPIADAAEELAKDLRYILKDLYERGDKYAEDAQKKFFEYYGLPVMAGGRRTAASVAAQYLKRIPCVSTIYVCSSESRCLLRFSERGLSKTALIRLTLSEMLTIAEENGMNLDQFSKNYLIDYEEKDGVCMFQVAYDHTPLATFPKNGKLRGLKPDQSWITICGQHILPKPGIWNLNPISVNIVYAS